MRDRVLFLDRNDLLCGYQLDRIEDMEIPDLSQITINDAIEFYEIKRYFDAEIHLKTWTEDDYEAYKMKSKKLYGLTMCYFNTLTNDNAANLYGEIDISYRSVFWQLFSICKLQEKLSGSAFTQLIQSEHINLFDLLEHKEIVSSYGLELRNFILADTRHIRLIIHAYEQDFTPGKKIYLPDELTGEDILQYISQYIDSPTVNPNHLEILHFMHPTKKIPITDELRLAAKRRYHTEAERISKDGVTLTSGVRVLLSPAQKEEKTFDINSTESTCTYSTAWLKDTLDYPSVFNNFIYIFEFVDVPQMRSLQVYKRSHSGVFDFLTRSRSSRMYPNSLGFNTIQNMGNLQMHVYYEFLHSNNVCFEEALRWVFTQYLQEEFQFPEMRVRFPSQGTTYSEKCTTIVTAFESILKQYSLYAKHGTIDFELVAMSSSSVKLDFIPSLLKKKYVYGKGNEYASMTNLMFSDQCMLAHIPRIYDEGKHYNCFLELLQNESISLSDYHERDIQMLRYLEEKKLIQITSEGKIALRDIKRVSLLYDLYQHDVINISHYANDIDPIIKEWENAGIIYVGNTLFSEPEVDYLNYLLNRSEYDNGLELRNRYAHGVLQIDPDESVHKQNYFILLRVMVLLAIKINDELCSCEQLYE